jgi:Iap family predicted aminopeptidase
VGNTPAVVDPSEEIEQLTAVRGRQAGSDAERRAANHLKRRLEALGREVAVEPIAIHPRWHLTHLIHALLAIAGSAISVGNALVGTILVAVAAVSTLGDVSGRLALARRLTGQRASQNVVSAESRGRPGRLILTAHYDSARQGAAFGRLDERRAAIGRLVHRTVGPAEPFVWSILLLLVTSAARLAGLDNSVLSAVQFVPTVVLIVSVPFLVDVALSEPSPGANDNASGVATVLRLADRYGGALDHLEVDVLLPGAQEAGALGMRAWLRRHRKGLDPLRTIVLNVDEVGAGTVRYAVKEGPLLALRQHPRLAKLCEQIRDEDAGEGRYQARPLTARRPGDAHAARARGLPAITISCAGALDRAPHHHRPTDTPDQIDPAALERAFGFCSELIELIDEEIGPDIAATASAAAATLGSEASFTRS